MRQHALLSASGAERWYQCPPSARLEEQFPASTSTYAEEGTLAHRVAEAKVTKKFTTMPAKEYNALLREIKKDPLYQPEMLKHADIYVDHIEKIVHSFSHPPHVAFEQRVDFSHVVPEGFGTCDCLIIGGNTLFIIDYKYGQGVPVVAKNNHQMALYAIGALAKYALLYDIKQITMMTIQPRLDNISEFTVSREQLEAAAGKLKEKADLAYSGGGEFKEGDWCRFCRAKAVCRARANAFTPLADFGYPEPPTLSHQEIGDILEVAERLKKWVEDIRQYALQQSLDGIEIPGWKAVAGRSIREWADQETAFNRLLASGYEEAMLYERKPLSLAAIEKLIGKKTFQSLMKEHVVTPPGKPTLAPATDAREAITNRPSPEDEFEKVEVS